MTTTSPAQLDRAMRAIKKVVQKDHRYDPYLCARIQAKDGAVYVSGTDGKARYTVAKLPAHTNGDSTLDCLAYADKLADIAKLESMFGNPTISLSTHTTTEHGKPRVHYGKWGIKETITDEHDQQYLTLDCGGARYELKALAPDAWGISLPDPTLIGGDGAVSLVLSYQQFSELTAMLKHFAADHDGRPALECAHITWHEGVVMFQAADGYRAVRRSYPDASGSDIPGELLINAAQLDKTRQGIKAKPSELITLHLINTLDENCLWVEHDGILCALPHDVLPAYSKFPDLQGLIDQQPPYPSTLMIDRKALADLFKRAGVGVRGKEKAYAKVDIELTVGAPDQSDYESVRHATHTLEVITHTGKEASAKVAYGLNAIGTGRTRLMLDMADSVVASCHGKTIVLHLPEHKTLPVKATWDHLPPWSNFALYMPAMPD